jgi:2-polyprenyl-3-methyl-5-hydroxy-6-metoxy-1,4-benzoquinol methylase
MEIINCIFCGIENDYIAIQENGYLGRKCSQCGLIYISPRPSHEEITNLYSHDDAQIHAETHISSEFSKRLHAKHNLRIITSYVKDGALLEIGAGAGYFLDEARKIGFEPYGIEFNPIQATFIKNKLGIYCEETTLTGSLFNGRNFDVVYHCDVISHLFDSFKDFRNIYNRT